MTPPVDRGTTALLRRRSRRLFGIFALMFGGIAALPVAPWVMGIVTDARHSYTEELPVENRGVYLATDEGVMQLFTWSVEVGRFPRDAPMIEGASLNAVMLVQRHFVEPRDYLLYDLDRQGVVPWQTTRLDEKLLTLQPGDLEAGRYVLLVPTDSSFGGVNRHFFAIS